MAATPDTIKALRKAGYGRVVVEKGAGVQASFPDELYEAAGAIIGDTKTVLSSDVVLKIRPPSIQKEVPMLKPGGTLISFVYPAQSSELLEALKAQKMTVLGMVSYCGRVAPVVFACKGTSVASRK